MNATVLKNPSDMSLKELVQAVVSTRVGLLWTFVAALATYTTCVFGIAESFQKSSTAIEFARPFKINLEADNMKIGLDRVALLRVPDELADKGQVIYEVHRLDAAHPERIENVGLVVAERPEKKGFDWFGLAALDLIASAQAQEKVFDWLGHAGNFKFREEYVSKNTVRRIYDDGWILEYDVDAQRNAVAASFRWVTTK